MKLTPELRFPEFDKDGEWETESLGDVADVYQPKTISQTDLSEEGYPVYGANGIIGFYHEYNHETNQIAIACRGSSCGTVNFTKPKSWITGNAMVVNVDQFNKIDKEFMFFQLDHANLDYLVTGSGQPQITGSIKKHEVFIPPLKEEQQKIASCLSSLDELIAAHNDKLDALKDHKKGLLQNLFPQEGETVPKVRFPEFEDDGEWVEDDIGTLFKFKQGVQVPVSNQFPEQGDDMVRFIRIIDITSNNEPPRYIQHPGDSHIISKDDLFMIRYGTPGLISIGFEGVIANNLFRLIWKSEKRNQPKFWFYAFQRLESFIYNLSSSSSMPAISFSTLEGLKIGFPPTIEEQQKIASCLSALDELITSQQEKIDQLQQHKKGMMQGLFPKIES